MSYEDEKQCLTRSLKRTGWVLGILVALLIAAVIAAALVN
jgi:hypothetical protein